MRLRLYLRVMALLLPMISYPLFNARGEVEYFQVEFLPDELSYEYTNAPDGMEYVQYAYPDCAYAAEPGHPQLPMKRVSINIPTEAININVRRENDQLWGMDWLYASIYPGQAPRLMQDSEIFTEPDAGVYYDGMIHNDPVILSDHIVNGNTRMLHIGVPVMGYEGGSNYVETYFRSELVVEYDLGDVDEMPFIVMDIPESALTRNTENTGVDGVEEGDISASDPSQKPAVANNNYTIITPEEFTESLEPLVRWKRQKGYDVELKTVEDILAEYGEMIGPDNSEKMYDEACVVRKWIIDRTNQVGSGFLLLVGDGNTSFPIRKFFTDYRHPDIPYSPEYTGNNFVPSDVYFSDITSDFKLELHENGYYTADTDYIPYSPELPTGRLLANKSNSIKNYIEKLLIYELDPGHGQSSYLNKMLGNRLNEFATIPNFLSKLSHKIPENADYVGKDAIDGYPSGKEIIQTLKECGIASFIGHGHPGAIGISGKRKDEDHWTFIKAIKDYGTDKTHLIRPQEENSFDCLGNWDKPSIIYSVACKTMPYETSMKPSEKWEQYPWNMGSSFTMGHKYGGVAFIGNTRDSWVDYNGSPELCFGQEISKGATLGSALISAGYMDPYWLRHNKFTRNLLGDPELKPWMGAPGSCDIIWNDETYSLMGNSLPFSRVSLYNGQTYNATLYCGRNDISFTLPHLKDQQEDYMVSVFPNGVLPKFFLVGTDISLSKCEKFYYVNTLEINSYSDVPRIRLQDKSKYSISATRLLDIDNGFSVEGGSSLILKSDKEVRIKGNFVKSNGTLLIEAEEATIDAGFSVERGGQFEIVPKIR